MRILDILYPRRCPLCEEILEFGSRRNVCKNCEKTLPYIREPRCRKCGKALKTMEAEYCYDCSRHKHGFRTGAGVFAYNDIMKQSIYRFKYHNKREYAAFYAEQMNKVFGRRLAYWNPEVIIPIPLHKSKYRIRGFNQAKLVADGLGDYIGVPVDEKLLKRTVKTIPQKELSREERRANLRAAFEASMKAGDYKRILLIDDIYTTGATLDAAADVLKKKGAGDIFFLTICVGSGE